MRFQKGQVVKVRDDLYTMGVDGVFNLWTDMCKFAGEEVVISEARETPWGDRYEIVGSPRCWTEECFVEVQKACEVHRPAKVGEWIKVTNIHSMICHERKIGDIFLIDGINERPDKDGYIWGSGLPTSHYVVLERYRLDKAEKELADFTNREICEELLRRFS